VLIATGVTTDSKSSGICNRLEATQYVKDYQLMVHHQHQRAAEISANLTPFWPKLLHLVTDGWVSSWHFFVSEFIMANMWRNIVNAFDKLVKQ